MRRIFVLLGLACMLFDVAAHAQKNEFAAEAAAAFPSANNLSFDPALGFQLNYAHRLIGIPGAGLYIEFPFVAGFGGTRTLASLVNGQSYDSIFFTPGVKLKLLPAFFISPYLAGGIGVSRFNSSTTNASDSGFAADIGGGLDVKVFPHLSLRGEIRDFITSTPGLNLGVLGQVAGLSGTTNNIIASGGLVIRF